MTNVNLFSGIHKEPEVMLLEIMLVVAGKKTNAVILFKKLYKDIYTMYLTH